MKDLDADYTYKDWLKEHYKVGYPEIVKGLIKNIDNGGRFSKVMVFFEIKKEK